MANEILDTFGTYSRLIMWPVLSYTLIIYAWGILVDKNREYAHVATVLSLVFMMLWGTAIIYYITKDNALMYDFGSIGLVPIGFISIIYMWVTICRSCRKKKKEAMEMHAELSSKE